jgi:GT2 family glycosyltransferase
MLDSVAAQSRLPDQIMIVDASQDSLTEEAVRRRIAAGPLAREVRYCRVVGALRGLTRQRNLALRSGETDLIAFFDDDIVLLPEALAQMEHTHRSMGDDVVGVGAYIQNQHTDFLPPTKSLIEGDWLPGGATMWRTKHARETGFNEQFTGYCSGEDLEFSLRIGRSGRLLLNGGARVLHLHESGGRPDHYRLGFSAVQNQRAIHLHCMCGRRPRDAAWFAYAQVVDLFLRSGGLLRPGTAGATWRFIHGRVDSLLNLAWRRTASS